MESNTVFQVSKLSVDINDDNKDEGLIFGFCSVANTGISNIEAALIILLEASTIASNP